MQELYRGLLAAAAIVLLLGLLSRPLKRYGLPSPLLALLGGILLGPQVFGLLQPDGWGQPHRVLEHAAQLSLAIGLMSVALRLPPGYVQRHWRPLAVLVGAVVCPTDHIVATSVVTGEIAERNRGARLLASDGEHWHVVQACVVEAGQQVGGTRSGGGDAHPQLAGELGVRRGHEGGHLLVASLDELDLLPGAAQRAEYPVDAIPRIAIDAPYSPLVKALDNEITDCHGHGNPPLRSEYGPDKTVA